MLIGRNLKKKRTKEGRIRDATPKRDEWGKPAVSDRIRFRNTRCAITTALNGDGSHINIIKQGKPKIPFFTLHNYLRSMKKARCVSVYPVCEVA